MTMIPNARPFGRLAMCLVYLAIAFGCNAPDQWSDKSNWYESARTFNPEYPDVFYLVSTNIVHEEGSLIADYSPEEKALLTKEMSFIESHLFPDSLNFFAPYYHQHTLDAVKLDEERYDRLADGIADEAYDAFHYYMEHLRGGRPVVLDDAAFSINPVNWKTDSTPACFGYAGQDLSVTLDTASMALVVSGFEPGEPPFTPVHGFGLLAGVHSQPLRSLR